MFDRGLNDSAINFLSSEADKQGWWRDILDDSSIVIGIRKDYLNAYWQGQSIFKIRLEITRADQPISIETHPKYLLDPDLKDYVPLSNGYFGIKDLKESGFMSNYEPGKTLAKMKRAANQFSGLEKRGCHAIAIRNSNVIDCEIGLPADESEEEKQTSRIDIACLEQQGDGIRLAFWEAKHFFNRELRAQNGDARVVSQVTRYASWILSHQSELKASYRKVAKNLLAISNMGWKRPLGQLIKNAASDAPISIDTRQPVGLLIFGFDQDQKDGKVWQRHRAKLDQIGRVHDAGNADNIRLPIYAGADLTEDGISEETA